MAHKKAGGSTQLGRDSIAKRLGVKRFGGARVKAGEVLVRQKGTKFRPGRNTYVAGDWTIHAKISGIVVFSQKKIPKFSGKYERATFVHVAPSLNE